MAFPRRLLTSGEELVLDLRPHWIALVGPALATVVLLVALGLGLTNLPHWSGRNVVRWAEVMAAAVLFVAYPLRRTVAWATSHFVVTNERVIHRSGLIAKDSMEIPLDRIQNVRFHQGVLERLIGAGDVTLESAGEQGINTFEDVRHPEIVQKVIYEHAEAFTMRMQGGYGAGRVPQAPPSPTMTQELERLADLRDRGAITEEEYRTHKDRILGGS